MFLIHMFLIHMLQIHIFQIQMFLTNTFLIQMNTKLRSGLLSSFFSFLPRLNQVRNTILIPMVESGCLSEGAGQDPERSYHTEGRRSRRGTSSLILTHSITIYNYLLSINEDLFRATVQQMDRDLTDLLRHIM